MDDLSLVARMWNEELAAALALDSGVLNAGAIQLNASLSDTDPNAEEAIGNASGLSIESSGTPSRPGVREETYFSYDKIDEDIREEELEEMRKKDLSTIREEQESLNSTYLGAVATSSAGDEEEEVETGRSLLSQLQMKNRLQRQLELSDSSDSDGRGVDDDDEDDDEDVLVVDLENKRAVMLDGHSPKLKAAIASQNYDGIFGSLPFISPSSSNLPVNS